MNFKQNFFVIAVSIFAVAVTASGNDFYHHDSNMGLLNFMSRSNNLFQRNPTRSLDCFNYYIPLINKIAQEYESNYKSCLSDSAAGRLKVDEATVDQRTDLANRTEASCALLSKCGESESVELEFECYIKGGSENAKSMYGINSDASDALAALTEEYRLIQNKENTCTNDTKRVYEKESAEAYDNLNNCILGISEVPTEAPATNAPTDAPTVSPNDSSTGSPTDSPTDKPTDSSSDSPTNAPTDAPTNARTDSSSNEDNSTEENSTEESGGDTKEDRLPEEDLSRMLAMKNLKYRF